MADSGGSGVHDWVLWMAAASVRVPVVLGFTVLGAGVLVGRELVRLVAKVVPEWGAQAPPTRHHAGRVKESARAAERAARASGLLSSRRR